MILEKNSNNAKEPPENAAAFLKKLKLKELSLSRGLFQKPPNPERDNEDMYNLRNAHAKKGKRAHDTQKIFKIWYKIVDTIRKLWYNDYTTKPKENLK